MHDTRTSSYTPTSSHADPWAGLDDGPTMRQLIGTHDDPYLGGSALDLHAQSRSDAHLRPDRDNRKAEVTFAETVMERRGVVETRREVTVRLSQDRLKDVLDGFRLSS